METGQKKNYNSLNYQARGTCRSTQLSARSNHIGKEHVRSKGEDGSIKKLTPFSRVLLKTLIVVQLIKMSSY
jgi:hypothetical protein